ncbi:MAG: site-specific DNA-methyltransferase [Candidatus Symbiobacter sp.]|nr:site-specific DNA-methyltransferase [Candidatus Symbiobacter sp.]
MVKGDPAPRNRSLRLDDADRARLSEGLRHFSQKTDLASCLDRVIEGDCLEQLKYLPPQSVDLLVVDPPYNLSKNYGARRFRQQSPAAYEAFLQDWLRLCVALLKPNASIYVCSEWRSSYSVQKILAQYFIIQNRITWEREKGRAAKQNWKNACEDIWFCSLSPDYYFDLTAVKLVRKVIAPYKNAAGLPKDWHIGEDGNFRLTAPSNLWTDIAVPFWSMQENTDHPTQKPEKLIAKLILASSRPGAVVLDPFLGSGTSAVVAKKLGRHYIGIEQNPDYCLWAAKRLELADHDKAIQGYEDGFFFDRNTKFDTVKLRKMIGK